MIFIKSVFTIFLLGFSFNSSGQDCDFSIAYLNHCDYWGMAEDHLLKSQHASQISAEANILVGNGGDGVKEGDQIYLRELFYSGLHRSAFIGHEVSQEILLKLRNSSIARINAPVHLLAQKLTSVEKNHPNLGHSLLAAIVYYDWILDRNFKSSDPLHSSFSSIQPLANRYLRNIFLNKETWNNLNETHKVALILHEVVYSLIIPDSGKYNLMSQDVAKVHSIIIDLFRTQERLSLSQMSWLAYPAGVEVLKSIRIKERYYPTWGYAESKAVNTAGHPYYQIALEAL